MKITFNKHVRWRVDNQEIFICDCKRLIDFKLPIDCEIFMNKIDSGLNEIDLNTREKKLLTDLNKMKLLSKFEIRDIRPREFDKAMKILESEFGKNRVRDNDFLKEKFCEFPQFFIGAFIDEEIIGVVCGFPREDYLLLSELAVDRRFQKRGFGKQLVKEFERVASKKINVGAEDSAIGFYKSLNYKPFLLIQFEKGKYSEEDFSGFKVLRQGNGFLEADADEVSLEKIEDLKKRFSNAYFQYIFTNDLKEK